MINHKGTDCPCKPILCQEGYCQDCQIYADYQGHQRTMGRATHGSITPKWLEEREKEQADKLSILRKQIRAKRDNAFNESGYIMSGYVASREHREKLQAMVNAYDVCLKLIEKALGGKNETD